jgi:RHS repeat-associated protein
VKTNVLTNLIVLVCIFSICGMALALDEAVLTPTNDSVKSAEEEAFNSAMSGSSQVVTESGVYDAYGNAVATYGTAPNFGYAGQYRYYADATGLHYLKARYYDTVAGRFLSRDPIGCGGGLNLYEYADGNPVILVDPTGEWPWNIT